jgi:hypothetical protein
MVSLGFSTVSAKSAIANKWPVYEQRKTGYPLLRI